MKYKAYSASRAIYSIYPMWNISLPQARQRRAYGAQTILYYIHNITYIYHNM